VVGFHTHYESLTHLYWDRILGTITRGYFEMLNRLLFRSSAVVLANSAAMVDIARRTGAREVELVGTPIPREFVARPVTAPGRELTKVLFAGRLAAEKNLHSVIEAAEHLPEIEFHIAGDGPMRRLVTDRTKTLPNLRYMGWLARPELRAALDRTDLLVLPSHVESFGTIALEAMCRARSVLVSAHCGILEWPALSRGLFGMHEHESVAAAITRIASLDPTVRQGKARLARDAAIELNDRNLDHWLRLLSEHGGPSKQA
jgi:glycosyltransferase involved in cell wall biosynthesis